MTDQASIIALGITKGAYRSDKSEQKYAGYRAAYILGCHSTCGILEVGDHWRDNPQHLR